MRVLLVGAGAAGSRVLRQLRKNPKLTILIADPRERPPALEEKLIDKVDYREVLTPLTLEFIVSQARPDLVLIATETEDLGLGSPAGVEMLAEALRDEVAAVADVPILELARD